MVRTTLVLVSLVAIAAAITTSAFGQRATVPVLKGTVGPGYSITLKQNGKLVKTLKAGTYKFVIADKASIHAFDLDGPHDFAKDFTTVPFVGSKTVTLKLKKGSYKYYCVAHESTMFAHFTVK